MEHKVLERNKVQTITRESVKKIKLVKNKGIYFKVKDHK